MRKFYFFSSLSEIVGPDPNREYGPRDQPLEDQFATSQFLTASASDPAKAIAVCNGQIIFQDAGNGLFNLILRPHVQPPFDFPEISYFIYRGIKPESLIANGGLSTDPEAPPFILNAVEAYRSEHGQAENPTPAYSQEVLGLTLNQNNTYLDSEPVDDLFERRVNNNGVFEQRTQPPFVKAGEALGEFADSFGFEVVLNQLTGPISNVHVRNVEGLLSVPHASIGGPDWFDAHRERDKCLNFVDPTAFFASFLGRRLYYWSSADDVGGTPAKADDLAELLPITLLFPHPNRVYIDIRDDYGNSLNFYHRDPDRRKVWLKTLSGELDPFDWATLKDAWGNWPLAFIEYDGSGIVENASFDNYGENEPGYFYTHIRFDAPDINEPVLYLSRAHRRKLRKVWPGRKIIEAIETRICLPMADAGQFLAGYCKFNLYDKKRDYAVGSQSTTPTVFPPVKESFMNAVFCPRLMVNTLAATGRDITVKLWDSEVLVNLGAEGGPCYVAKVGVAQDEKSITYFAVPVHFLKDAFRKKPAPALGGWMAAAENVMDQGGRKPYFLEYLSQRHAYQAIAKLPIGANPPSHVLAFEEKQLDRRAGILQANGRLEHCLFLTLSRDGTSSDAARINTLLQAQPSDGVIFWRENVPPTGTMQETMPDSGLTYKKREMVLTRMQEVSSAPEQAEPFDIPNSTIEVFELASS